MPIRIWAQSASDLSVHGGLREGADRGTRPRARAKTIEILSATRG